MAQLTVRQAAQHVGVTRSTMFRHVRIGRVSATTSTDGIMVIDTSELIRVYGEIQAPQAKATGAPDRQAPDNGQANHGATVAILTAQLEMAKERISELKERAQLDQVERDRLLAIVERQSRLLDSAPQKKRGFLDFFTG